MMFKLKSVPELKYLVTFIPNKIEPVHNWYWYKEGFSRQLVDWLIKTFDVKQPVLDPFCGIGTTNLACKQTGIPSIGFDVSPLCVFVAGVKTADYDLSALEDAVRTALKWKFERPKEIPQEKYLKKVLSKYALEDIVFYKSKIQGIEDEKIRNFLLLALLDSATKGSWAVKDGAFVRIQKHGVPPVGKLFKYKIRRMLNDLRHVNLQPIETKIEIGDARQLNLGSESIAAVITSPPYLNKIEYTKIYRLELELFFGFPETKLRAYIGGEPSTRNITELGIDLPEYENFPPVAQAYFYDIALSMKELYRVCMSGAQIAIIIGGGCFPDRVVECDALAAEVAQQVGFNINQILVARQSWCTRARTIKVGQMRESVITANK